MLIAPLTAFLSFASDDIIVLLWTEKWLYCSLLFKILIVGIMFGPVGQMSLSLMQALGRTGMVLKLEFPKKIVYCIYLFIGFQYGVVGLAIANVFINITGTLINVWATRKLLPYSYVKQLMDVSVYVIIAFVVGALSSLLIHFDSNIINILSYFVVIIVGYIVTLFVLKDKVLGKYLDLLFLN